jgi:hypothetical protein
MMGQKHMGCSPKNVKVKTGSFWEQVPVGRGRHKESVNGGKYGEGILYSCMKIEQ